MGGLDRNGGLERMGGLEFFLYRGRRFSYWAGRDRSIVEGGPLIFSLSFIWLSARLGVWAYETLRKAGWRQAGRPGLGVWATLP